MSRLRPLNQAGLTIIELSIALTITAALMAIIVGFSVDKLQQGSMESMKQDLLSNAETGLNRMATDVRVATSADDNNRWEDTYAPGAPSDLLSWQSNSATLVLATAAEDGSGNIIFDDPHDYVSAKNNVIYYLKDGSLWRRVLAASNDGNKAVTTCPPSAATPSCPADSDVLDNVSSFAVQYYDGADQQVSPTDAHSVQLTVQLKQHKYSQDITADYTTRMVFRNG